MSLRRTVVKCNRKRTSRRAQRNIALRNPQKIKGLGEVALEKSILNGSDAEFLITKSNAGKFYLRVGQVWNLPTLSKSRSSLLIDLDNCKKVRWWNICRRLSQCGVHVLQIVITTSPGGKGFHVAIVVTGKFSRFQRIALQSICESDPQREANNFRRARLAKKEWKENWNVLFQWNLFRYHCNLSSLFYYSYNIYRYSYK